jgi:hypothetical protein
VHVADIGLSTSERIAQRAHQARRSVSPAAALCKNFQRTFTTGAATNHRFRTLSSRNLTL